MKIVLDTDEKTITLTGRVNYAEFYHFMEMEREVVREEWTIVIAEPEEEMYLVTIHAESEHHPYKKGDSLQVTRKEMLRWMTLSHEHNLPINIYQI